MTMQTLSGRFHLILTLTLFFSLSTFAQPLKIFFIDMDQGDAVLIVSPGGRTLLIDSGDEGKGARIKDLLDQEGITSLDFFVCTHYHSDHYGGIDELVLNDSVPVGTFYDRGDTNYLPSSKHKEKAFRNYQKTTGGTASHLTRGMLIPLDQAMTVRCVASGGVVLNGDTATGIDENDMSIALVVQYGGFTFFTGGDVEKPTEAKIAALHLARDVDVCKADHHGSHMCSLPAFMQDMSPAVIIISNGSDGTYKHPRRVTLSTYRALTPPPVVFQTNKYLKSDTTGGNVPDVYIADPQTFDKDGTILLTVDNATRKYVVSYGDTSFTFTFKHMPSTSEWIVIKNLLPDPAGYDNVNEQVTLLNKGRDAVDLTGCFLKNGTGRIWSLDGLQIAAGDSLTVTRNNMPMSLRNTGDSITLIGRSNQVMDGFAYNGSKTGVVIWTGH